MSRKRHQRSRQRKKHQGMRISWLILFVIAIIVAYYAFVISPIEFEELGLLTDETSAPDFTPTPYPTPIAPIISGDHLDLDVLSAYMLELINVDRVAHGLQPVVWDNLAAEVGRLHAEDMAAAGYMSHWNMAGLGPDIRYNRAGGRDVVMENVFSSYQRYDDGSPVYEADWAARVREAQEALMNSPGHRANILTPEHTHVGVGMAYDAQTGEFRVAQEFLNRYISVDTGFVDQIVIAKPGDSFAFGISLLTGVAQPLINLAYEPLPQPLTISELDETSTYESPAVFVEQINHSVSLGGDMSIPVNIPQIPESGYYHVRIWINVNGEQIPASDIVISVSTNSD
ncbi:MAG: CAP domain-containing protein [Anaerolineales bacterium]|nr:CAP domain-containing protein [Anaerolineales bacterium]